MNSRASLFKKSKIALGLISCGVFLSLSFQNCGKFSTQETSGDPLNSAINIFAADSPAGPLIPDVATISADKTIRVGQRRADRSGDFKLVAGSGTVDPGSGLFTPSGNNTDAIIGRPDANGNWSYSFVKVAAEGSALALSPSALLVAPGQQVKLSAAGGTAPYSYFLNGVNHSKIDQNTGVLTAGEVDETFLVQVMDYKGKIAQSSVSIKKGTLHPMGLLTSPNPIIGGKPTTFVVMGGTGPYTLSQNSGTGSLAGQIYTPTYVPGTATFTAIDAQSQRLLISSKIIDDPNSPIVTVGNKAFLDPGTYQFVVPAFHAITVSVSGGSGGGGGGYYGSAGTAGSSSNFGNVLIGNGGGGGGTVYGFSAGASGTGGSATGGATNTVGGGVAGGTGGSIGYGDRGGTGGAGGLAQTTYNPMQLKPGTVVTVVVGPGGVGGINYSGYYAKNSGDGMPGKIIITWY